MAECRYFPECQRCNEVGDSWLPCAGGADGTRCKGYEPMPDVKALLDMEDEMFESATGLALISELEEDADLKDLQTTMAKILFGYARRIREACGMVDAG